MIGRNYLLGFLLLLLTSCSTYQYNTINSENSVKSSTNEFVSESDSLKITYNFSGQNPNIHITIQNKLSQPIYVDWKKSALITDNNVISYMGNAIPISGAINGYINGYTSNFSQISGDVNATASLPEGTTYIPPRSQAQKKFTSVFQFNTNLADTMFRDDYLKNETTSGTRVQAAIANFTRTNSPLVFRSYLTFIIDKQPVREAVIAEKEFYISKVLKTSLPPDQYLDYQVKPGDLFYIQEPTGYGKVANGLGMAAIVVGIAALNPSDTAPQQ